MDLPTSLDLLEFFECEPSVDDEVRIYSFAEASGLNLVFSYDPFYKWAKTQLLFDERVFLAVCCEGLYSLRIQDNQLVARFSDGTFETELLISLHPSISVEWNGLVKDQ